MDKLVVCTTGTSIGSNCGVGRDLLFSQDLGWDDISIEIEKKLASCLKEKDVHDTETRRSLSAELKSLDLLGLQSRDRVALLVTDTYQGRVCAEAVKSIITDVYGLAENQVVLHRIEGLQVRNAKRLREQGLKNMIKVILEDYLDDDSYKYSHEIIFNPTGGFKGVVPFLTIIGMLYAKKTVYVFENSNELIRLPPLPFTFDLKIYDRVKSALKYIDDEIAVSEAAYLGKIVDYTAEEHELFMAFIEPFDDHSITLSPLAHILMRHGQDKPIPLISGKVRKTLEKCKDHSGRELRAMIMNSTDPLWRQQHGKKWGTTNLTIMKSPRRPERLAGFVRDGQFHVALAFSDHQDYGRELANYKIESFQSEKFSTWEPETTEELDNNLLNCEKKNDGLSQDNNQLRIDKKELDKKLAKVKTEAHEYEQKADYLSMKLPSIRHENEMLVDKTGELKRQLQTALARLDGMDEQARTNKELVQEVAELKAQLHACNERGFVDHIKSIFKRS